MSFDPTKPVDSSQIVAAELRSQFTARRERTRFAFPSHAETGAME
jgi:hypothetical protein